MTNAVLDVAIIGGGVSGIYTAYKLKQHDKKLNVAVFEGSDRIGGRLLSARSYDWPGATCELGGMRYIAGYHTQVANLVKELGLATYDMPEVDQAQNIAYLRNCLLRISELSKSEMLPFNFDRDEKEWLEKSGKPPFSLIVRMLLRELPDLKKYLGKPRELRDYLQGAKIYGETLTDWGFWNLLLRAISGEGYKAGRDTIGYDVLGLNYNAADMIAEIFQFGEGVDYKMLREGYEALPYELSQRFIAQQMGGEIYFRHWLEGFEYQKVGSDTDGIFSLRFIKKPEDQQILVKSKKIVLAMPRRSIELLLCESPPLKTSEWFQQRLNAVAPIPLYKLFLIYKTPWWEEVGVVGGRSLTDLPMRQCYYWPLSPPKNNADSTGGPGAIMVYNDELNVSFWSGLKPKLLVADKLDKDDIEAAEKRLHPKDFALRTVESTIATQPAFFKKSASFAPPDPPPVGLAKQLYKNWDERPVDKHQIREIERQLLRMHGKDKAPELLDAAYQDWTDDPFGGGVHLWKVGYKSSRVMEEMIKPIPSMHCYICGEAYSTTQTWVEGALETANLVLEKLGVTP